MKASTKKSKGSAKLKNSESLSDSLAVKIKDEESDNLKSPKLPIGKKHWKGPPTDEQRNMVRSYAAFGVTDDDIATVLGMCEATLQNNFGVELTEGRILSKTKIGEKLYNIAVGYEYTEEEVDRNGNVRLVKKKCPPNLTALIFLAKVRLGWKETQVVENVTKKSQTILYLPDNGTSDFDGDYGKDPNAEQK